MPVPSLDDYEVISPIGSGSYGTCKKIRRKKDGKMLVWKEMDYGMMSETEKQMLVSEVNLLRELKHKHIVRYYDRIVDRTNTTLYLIMEFCVGGDLSTLISKLKRDGRSVEEDFVWKICYQSVLALKECHSRQKNGKAVLHRDLKPANIFLDSDNNVKLGDFGLARVLNHETSFARTFVGTPYYMSPEQMKYMSYNNKSDIWSLGCLLYELCALRPPFTASTQKELAVKICSGRFHRVPLRFSDDLNTVIAVMIKVDEYKRPSIDDLLEHPLIVKRMCPPSPTYTLDQRDTSTSSHDEGYESKHTTLRKMEDELRTREKVLLKKENQLIQKERDLQQKEQDLQQRERKFDAKEKSMSLKQVLLEEKMTRLERMQDYTQSKKKLSETNLDCNSVFARKYQFAMKPLAYRDQNLPAKYMDDQSSILCNAKRDDDTPKKRVTFTGVRDKENLYNIRLPSDLHIGDHIEYDSHILDLQQRLHMAKQRSEELKLAEIAKRYQTRQFPDVR